MSPRRPRSSRWVSGILLTLATAPAVRGDVCHFTNLIPLEIPTRTVGSSLAVSAIVPPVTDVRIHLVGLVESTNGLEELDVLLVGPAGQEVVLLSFACLATFGPLTLEFSRAADGAIPSADLFAGDTCSSGSYLPGDYHDLVEGGYVLRSPPAPQGPYAGTLDDLVGPDANGIWTIYAAAAVPQDQARLESWRLEIEASACGVPSTALFADGFEGSSTCAWSLSLGGACPET